MGTSSIRVYDDGSGQAKGIIKFLEENGVDFEVHKSYGFRAEIGLMMFRSMEEFHWVLRNGGYIKKK